MEARVLQEREGDQMILKVLGHFLVPEVGAHIITNFRPGRLLRTQVREATEALAEVADREPMSLTLL